MRIKRECLFFVLIFVVLNYPEQVWGQNEKVKTYYPDGDLKSDGVISPNGKQGEWKYYYRSGKLKETINH